MSLPAPNEIQRARAALTQARTRFSALQAQIATSTAAINVLSKTAAANDPKLAAALRARDALLMTSQQARQDEKSSRVDLSRAVADFLSKDPTRDVELLDAHYPIVFFPVRIETRFDRSSTTVLIRVYPDEILADSHEPELTSDEEAAGKKYWSDVQANVAEAEAWRNLVGTYQSQRAAWIVRATDPQSGVQPQERPSTWTRAVEAPLLPDRWIAVAYRGNAEIARAWSSSPVIDPLPLTVGPDTLEAGTVPVNGGPLRLDDRVMWTIDFTRALDAGMAIRMPLAAADFNLGIDRLVVLGVKATIAPAEAVSQLEALLSAQHYTRGFAFVGQGTPTNDSKDAPSGYPPPDPNGATSFRIERQSSLATADGDGVQWTRALGISADLVSHIDGADRTEQAHAEAMNRALFPATWGYFLDTMMAPLASTETIESVKEFLVNHVRARGPLPAFRVGGVPYGTLPVSSLTKWVPQRETIEETLVPLLNTGLNLWAAHVVSAPHVGRSSDSDADLLSILAMDASARALRLRQLLGEDAQSNLNEFLGFDQSIWRAIQQSVAQTVLASLGRPDWDAHVLHCTFADQSQLFRFPFVTDPPVSEKDTLTPNYIHWIRTAAIGDLKNENLPFPVPNALLYRLLRYAALTEYWSQAKFILVASGFETHEALQEHELVRIVPGTETRFTVWQHFERSVPAVTGTLSLAQYLSPVVFGQPPRTVPESVLAYRDALTTLENLPTAELDRLSTETLDLSASRLDAWITALASKRLSQMRDTLPTGAHIGAFSWVENLRPRSDPSQNLSDGRVAFSSPGGYIHAPSMTQAATAAVLRNGFLTHANADSNSPYAMNLSSIWVRRARFVLESVQAGQPVGAVFGYQIERGLHERQAEVVIDPLRTLFPLVANKTDDSGQPAESVAARNVVDGLQLCTAWRNGKLTFGANGLPASGPDRVALEAELTSLEKTLLAVANLLLAESVHQIVRGSTMGASAALDSLAKGVRPPEPEVVYSPRGGTDLTHRVIAVLGGDPMPVPRGWPDGATPRATAEPRLDSFAGTILGDPRRVKCRVIVPPAPGSSQPVEHEVTLDKLGLRPLDILALAASVSSSPEASELDRRVIFAAIGDTPASGAVQVAYAAAPGWDRKTVRTVPEILEVAQAFSRIVGGGRPIRPQDLLRGEDSSSADTAVWADDEAMNRATSAEAALTSARVGLNVAIQAVPAVNLPTEAQLAALRSALRTVADFGFRAAFPVPGKGLEEGGVAQSLIDQAKSVLAEVDSRIAAAGRARPGLGATRAQRATSATDIASQVFGRDFVLLPGFQPARGPELTQALSSSAALVGDPRAPIQWFQQVTRIRAPLQRWRKLRLFAGVLDSPNTPLQIAQLPYVPGGRWAALPFAQPTDRKSGVLSLALFGQNLPATNSAWFGIHVDEWVEVVPNPTELTGLAFHYDDPGAEAAQNILIAVPPDPFAKSWDFDTVMSILNETFDLARIRGVDWSLLGELGQILPAIYMAQNANNDTVIARFAGSLSNEKIINAVSTLGGGQ
jgi:hypothetical protein